MNKKTFNQTIAGSSGSEDKTPFEIHLTPDQFKLLQKILPVGYSLTVADKYTRAKHKRGRIYFLNLRGKPDFSILLNFGLLMSKLKILFYKCLNIKDIIHP